MKPIVKQGATATKDPQKDYWQTPEYILKVVRSYFFGYYFDPAPVNPEFDGLAIDWDNVGEHRGVYINPPFSKYEAWAKYGYQFHKPQIWMCHHNHDTKWFKLLMSRSYAICLLDKRVKFIDHSTGQDSLNTAFGKCQSLIYTGQDPSLFADAFGHLGRVFKQI